MNLFFLSVLTEFVLFIIHIHTGAEIVLANLLFQKLLIGPIMCLYSVCLPLCLKQFILLPAPSDDGGCSRNTQRLKILTKTDYRR